MAVKSGYKVLGLQRQSLLAPVPMVYPADQWVSKKEACGPLAVFAEYCDAASYIMPYLDKWAQIHKCEFVESKEHGLYCRDEHGNTFEQYSELPSGTLFADHVKCLD